MRGLNPNGPFACIYSPQLPELLAQLGCSIVLTTHQAGKVVFVSPLAEDRLSVLPRAFDEPMGLARRGDSMALATSDEIIVFQNSRELAAHYPRKANTYDSLFVPRATYYTGRIAVHDVALGDSAIWAVSSLFSCLCRIDATFNFVPEWKPPFVSALTPDDRCHLNGLAVVDSRPKFVTALGASDTPSGWRGHIMDGGLLIDVETDAVILDKLAMPHSPMMHNGSLYLLLSASGEVIKVDVEQKSFEVIRRLDGFCRGMDIHGDYLFVGMSKLRKNSSTFAQLPFAGNADWAGVQVIHLPTRALAGELRFRASVDEIYAVSILADSVRPNMLGTGDVTHKASLAIPGHTFWAETAPDNENV
jgi:uncharacterized protein (TIGR03032 family)